MAWHVPYSKVDLSAMLRHTSENAVNRAEYHKVKRLVKKRLIVENGYIKGLN